MPVPDVSYRRFPQSQLVVLAQRGDAYACEYLLAQLRPQIAAIIRRIDPHGAVSREDLLSTATEAALEMLSRFDPAKGVQFATYAHKRIEGAIIDMCRRIGPDRPEAPVDTEAMLKAEM